MYKDILLEVKNSIALLTINLPEVRNTITGSNTINEIESACRKINADRGIKTLIITGADPAFSAGGNIKEMKAREGMFSGTSLELMENYRRNVQRIPLAIHNVEVPTIAAVNGPAVGAGCDLALMCDIRIASQKASFGETFLNIGLIPGDGGAYFLPRAVGMARACELTFTGDVIDAERAFDMGMVNHVVEHEELLTKSKDIAGRIIKKSAAALRMAKKLLYMGQDSTLPQLLEQSAAYQALCHYTKDHEDALDAVLEGKKGKSGSE